MGPLLLKSQPLYLSTTFTAMIVANIAMIFISLLIARIFAQVLRVPYYVLGTLIMMLAITGCYAYQASLFDITVMIVGGIFGYFFKKYKFNTTALILGLVLGSDTEYYLRRGLMMKGSFMKFFERPIFCVLFAAFVILYGYTPVSYTHLKRLVFKFCQIICCFLIASFYDKPGLSARHTTGAFSFSGFGTLPENNESTVRIRE